MSRKSGGWNAAELIVKNVDEMAIKLSNSEFEIILLDIEMPIMNGVEALREIRLHHKAKVIIVSSLAQIGSTYSAEVKKLGADGIIDKPGGALDPTLAQKKGEDLKHLIKQLV